MGSVGGPSPVGARCRVPAGRPRVFVRAAHVPPVDRWQRQSGLKACLVHAAITGRTCPVPARQPRRTDTDPHGQGREPTSATWSRCTTTCWWGGAAPHGTPRVPACSWAVCLPGRRRCTPQADNRMPGGEGPGDMHSRSPSVLVRVCPCQSVSLRPAGIRTRGGFPRPPGWAIPRGGTSVLA